MDKAEYYKTLQKKSLSMNEKVDVFNYYIKNEAPPMIADGKTWLSDCEIKEPTSQNGIGLLNNSVLILKKMYLN